LHPDISKLFMHLRYHPFPPEGTVDKSTEQLLKKFRGETQLKIMVMNNTSACIESELIYLKCDVLLMSFWSFCLHSRAQCK